jgi:hypothetical protein
MRRMVGIRAPPGHQNYLRVLEQISMAQKI